MCKMPTEQEPHEVDEGTPLPNPYANRRPPLPNRGHGPDHPTPNQQRIQCYPHDSRSQMHERSCIPPLQNDGHRTRNSKAILQQCLPMVRPTQQGYIRQRPLIYIPLCESPRPTIRDQTKCVFSIPPPDRQTIRANKPMGGTIPLPDHQQRPN
jgi:hypothetical protein